MPELPEVETIKNILDSHLNNKVIKEVVLYREKTIDGDPITFVNALKNKTIHNISRKGKYLIFNLSDNLKIISHLRMEGKYYYFDNTTSTTKYPMVKYIFMDNTSLIYDDMRKFGIMWLKDTKNYLSTYPLNELGLEPFDFTRKDINNLYLKFRRSNHHIKELIMDQHNIAGLGNIYADEVLFLSKIHPLTKGCDLAIDNIKDIISNSIITLNKAIKLGGSTIKSYHPSEGVSGLFQENLLAYGQYDKPCQICKEKMIKIRVGGRGTTYCPRCQKNYSKPKVFGLTGKVGSGKSTVKEYLKENGFNYIDADEVVHNLYEDKKIQKRIVKLLNLKEFSLENIKKSLSLDKNNKTKLEDYIHPLVKERIFEFIFAHNKGDIVLIEVPLLFESNLDFICDEIIFVDVSESKQKENLLDRGSDVDYYLNLNKNFDYQNNKKKSSIVIYNNSNKEDLYKEINKKILNKI